VLESMALRRIFGPKRQDVTGCRKLHTDKLHNVFEIIKFKRLR
jgi:hypothetical protein